MVNEGEHLVHLLKNVTLFSGLDRETLGLLLDSMYTEVYEEGEIICKEGDSGDRMFVVESGEIAVIKKGLNDIQVEITNLLVGDVAGEMSLFGPGIRSATLQAKERTRIWILKHSEYKIILEQSATLANAMLMSLSSHLSSQSSVMAKLISKDVDKRLKICFFDSKPYMESVFKDCNEDKYNIQFFESRLTLKTVALAAGSKVVCVFVNDKLEAEVIRVQTHQHWKVQHIFRYIGAGAGSVDV